ncbi:MAG: tetratricopeptide repeat protein [Gemmatimonadetes bacterium]|nr:tetratricopeptide repeat protein [Gemmatimonadota bacterium]
MANPFLSSEEYDERAHRFYESGEYDQALEVLNEGIILHPDSTLLHVGIGYVRIAREEYAWARRSFETALEVDDEYEDAWVGLGETLLKFGEIEDALRCFARIDAMGLSDDLEIGLAVGRALYREGLFTHARHRFTALVAAHPEHPEVAAARGYTLHALGDDVGARRELRRALRLDPELHEARIYLSHLLYDRGDTAGALQELERVPPAEHWDTLSVWRFIDLKCSLEGVQEGDASLAPWHARLEELEGEPDEIEHLLAEVEAAFEIGSTEPAERPLALAEQVERLTRALPPAPSFPQVGPGEAAHRVSTEEGRVFSGSWEEIVVAMRDASSHPGDSLAAFMLRSAERVRERTGRRLPCDDAESFVRGIAEMGLVRIDS